MREKRRKLNLGLQFQRCSHYLAKCPHSVQGSSLLAHKPGPFRGIPSLFLSAQVSQAGNEHDHLLVCNIDQEDEKEAGRVGRKREYFIYGLPLISRTFVFGLVSL